MKTFEEWLDDQDGRMWSCDICGEVCFDETCDYGHQARPLSGRTCYDLGLLDDEAKAREEFMRDHFIFIQVG